MKIEFDPNKVQVYLPSRTYKGGHLRRSVVLITQDCELSAKYKEPVYIFAEAQCSEEDNFNKLQGRSIALGRINKFLSDRTKVIRGIYTVRHSELFNDEGKVRLYNAVTPISHTTLPGGVLERLGDLICHFDADKAE